DFGLRDVRPGELPSITGEDPATATPASGSEVTLTTSKHQENFTFFRPTHPAYDARGEKVVRRDLVPDLDPKGVEKTYPFYRPEPALTLSRLPALRPSVFYILGGTSNLS